MFAPAALLKPPLNYLAIPQWPVLELLILRAFTPDMPLRRAGTPERRVGKHRQEKETSQGKNQVLRDTEPAEELLQTTLVLPWAPRPLSKELCSLLTSLGQERPSPVTQPLLKSPLTAQEVQGVQKWAETFCMDADSALYS